MGKCHLCNNLMPHIPNRQCRCHDKSCVRYNNAVIKGHCTIFRKLSNEDLRQPAMSKEDVEDEKTKYRSEPQQFCSDQIQQSL